MIRNAKKTDAKEICTIYNPYILNSTISFETEPVTEKEMVDEACPKCKEGLIEKTWTGLTLPRN